MLGPDGLLSQVTKAVLERALCEELTHHLGREAITQLTEDLHVSESCLHNWMAQADCYEGRREGLTSDERKELAALRREKRRLDGENEILRRAAAYMGGVCHLSVLSKILLRAT